MPRVAVVLPPREAFSPDGSGAIGLLAHRLAAASRRYEVRVLGSPVAAPFSDVRFVPLRPAWWPGALATRAALAVHRHLRVEAADLIEVHNRPDMARFLARRGHRVILILHNDPQGMRGARSATQRRRLLRRVARVATVSEWLRARFAEGLAADGLDAAPNLVVLPNCIDRAAMPQPADPRERTILFAGRMVADKGADSFVAACAAALAQLPGWRAEMIGADGFGPASRDTPFLRALRPRAAAAGVTLHGWQPHEAVLAAMARAAIVAVPSRWDEPFGLTALEAMAGGASLLYAPRGGLPEVAGEVGVRIDPDDVPSLAAAMVTLALDPARRGALAAAGPARARGFDVAIAAARLDALRDATLSA